MEDKYTTAFLLPNNSKKFLGDDGWEFESKSRIPIAIETALNEQLNRCEAASDCATYEGQGLKVDVFKDKRGEIENIYIRFYDGQSPEVPGFLKNIESIGQLEFFVPS